MAVTKINLDSQTEGRVLALGTTAASGQASLTLNNGTAAATNVTLTTPGSISVGGDINLTGNLNITGNVNTQSVTNTNIADITVTLNDGGTTASAAGAGLFVEGDSNSVIGKLLFDNTLTSKWKVGDGTTQAEVVTTSGAQTLTNKTIGGGQISGNITGNAANVTGTVLVANGGTGAVTLTGYVKGNGTAAMTASSTIPGSDISGNITGNAANVTGTVAVSNGGTGVATLTGLVKGNGTAAFSAAVAGTDYVVPSGNITGTSSNVTGTVVVANGGTGMVTTTPYAVFTGGTTATGAHQQVSGVGSSGQVLTSNGAGTLPTWQNPSGSAAYFHATTVTGAQDGSNKVFTVGSAGGTGSLHFWINGTKLTEGASYDYVLSGTTVTLNAGVTAPSSTAVITASSHY